MLCYNTTFVRWKLVHLPTAGAADGQWRTIAPAVHKPMSKYYLQKPTEKHPDPVAHLPVGGAGHDGGVIVARQRAGLEHVIAVPAVVLELLFTCAQMFGAHAVGAFALDEWLQMVCMST